MERTCSRFNDLKFRRNHVYVIAIVKFSKRSIQNLFHVDNRFCMDSRKLI